MTCIRDLSELLGKSVSGLYRVTAVKFVSRAVDSRTYLRLILEDCTGSCCAYQQVPSSSGRRPVQGDVVAVEMIPVMRRARISARLQSWHYVNPAEIGNYPALIPVSSVSPPIRAAAELFADVVDKMQSTPLRAFVNRIFHRHWRNLISASASRNHHHCQPGGLIVHLADTVERARQIAVSLYADDAASIELILCCALIHDLGKVVTHNGAAAALPIRHEVLNVHCAMPALRALHDEWPEAANYLARALNWFSLPPDARRSRPLPDAELVHFADIFSVWADRSTGARPVVANAAANCPESGAAA